MKADELADFALTWMFGRYSARRFENWVSMFITCHVSYYNYEQFV